MSSDQLSTRDREILNRIQSGYPLAPDPYAILAGQLGTTPDEALAGVLRLRRAGVVRRIGGSVAAAALGYHSTLVGARVAAERIEAAAAVASAFPEVTHNYERDGVYNLWFTVIAPDLGRLGHILAAVRQVPGVQALHDLPTRRLFKIRVDFDLGSGPGPAMASRPNASEANSGESPPALALDAVDRRLICRACGDLDESRTPFRPLAADAGIPESEALARLLHYRQAGAMRRFGAMLRHRAAGVAGNGMSVWNVPEPEVCRVGELLAACPEVSHCYERPRLDDWPYNLFAMLHGRDRACCQALAERIARAAGVTDYQVLFSGREFKKTSMVYFAEAPLPA